MLGFAGAETDREEFPQGISDEYLVADKVRHPLLDFRERRS